MLDISRSARAPKNEKAPKLAQQVAGRIEQDIIRLGWPVGHNLGSEAELAAHYGVGRWVLREAISIAASDGLLEIQRGRYGGLIVAAPAAQAVVVAIHNYLEFCRLELNALLEARLELESLALRLAAERIDAAAGRSLRALAAATSRGEEVALQPSLLRAVATGAGNQVIGVFTQALLEATRSLLRRQNQVVGARQAGALDQLRRAQIEAVIAGDGHRIHELQANYIDLWRELLTSTPGGARRNGAARPAAVKRTEQMTHGLLAKISTLGWTCGHGLGSEAELMAEFGVSRAVLREAIRPLERHGVVQMRAGRGQQSGLHIGAPDPAATVRTAALYLKHSRVPLADIFDVQEVLETAAVTSAANLDSARRKALGVVLAEAAAPQPSNAVELERYMRDFYLTLGDACGNPVYGLFMRILADMAGVDESAPPSRLNGELAAANCASCRQLAGAVRDGDISMSRRHMLDWRHAAEAMSPHERPLEQIVERD